MKVVVVVVDGAAGVVPLVDTKIAGRNRGGAGARSASPSAEYK